MRSLVTITAIMIMQSSTSTTAGAVTAARWTTSQGELTYVVFHKFHEVRGHTDKVELVALLDDSGLKVMARAPVASFDSGNKNRDAHVLEVLEASKFPYVTVKAVLPGFQLPAIGTTTALTLPAEVEFHGQKRQVPIELTLTPADPTHAQATVKFVTSLEGHGVERPSLLFVKVDDRLLVSGSFSLERQP